MKKIVTTIVLVAALTLGWSQIVIDSSRTFKAEAYAGVFIYPKMSTAKGDSGKVSVGGSLRGGFNLYWTPQKWYSMFGVGAIEVNEKGAVTPLYLVGVKFIPRRDFIISVGKIGTPMTELRPVPNTGAGQFEPWTKRKILSSAFGGKVTYLVKGESSVVAGAFWRNGTEVSIEVGAKTSCVQLGAYYQPRSRTFGAAASLTTTYVTQTIGYNYRKDFGCVTNVMIPKTKGLVVYEEFGFTPLGKWELVRLEGGILKTFRIKIVRGLIGLGYAHETKGVWGYLLIHL